MGRYIFTALFLVCPVILFGQLGHGGKPLGDQATSVSGKEKKERMVTLPSPPASVLSIDQYAGKESGQPLRFAHPNFVDLTPQNSGHTSVLEDGRLSWFLHLKSPGAYSLNLVFDKFRLAEGDSLFIYEPDGHFVIGALTHENNKSWGGLATAPVPGDEVIVEWRGNNTGRDGTQLLIGAVNHDYLNVFRLMQGKVGDFGDSGSCHLDFSCFGDETALQNGKSVCRIIVNGTELCSGTLMNNSKKDGIPYVLTAGHCLGSDLSPESVVFLFNYEVPACQSRVEGSSLQSISGSDLRAFADELDFALLEMSEYPPAYFRPYYAGWDLTSAPSAGLHSIHHPQGDVKKIATSEDAPEEATFSATSSFDNRFESDSHWLVPEWSEGTTEGGSSGAGLFMDKGAFIGHLSGGEATCSNPVNDYFVRLNKIWDYLPEDTARLDVWLNPPDDDEVASVEGFDPTEGDMLRLSHFPEEGDPKVRYVDNGYGFWSGPNSHGLTAVSEKFDELSSGKIFGVYMIPGKSDVNGDGTIDVQLWSGVDAPLELLARKEGVSVEQSQDKEVLVMFDEPVSFTGPFFVGYNIDYTEPVDSLGVYQMPLTESGNSFYVRDPQGNWDTYSAFSGNMPAALWIDVLVDEAVYTDSSEVPAPSKDLILAPNPAAEYVDLFYPEDGDGLVTIYDMNGKRRLRRYVAVFNFSARMDISGVLSAGTYLLQLNINGRKVVRKFMVR
ncbi:MAG: T9SS type A sorting domain-containing protein [Marinilabilia sp.]